MLRIGRSILVEHPVIFYMVGSCEQDGSDYIGSVHMVKDGAERAYESHARRSRNWIHAIDTSKPPTDRMALVHLDGLAYD